MSDDIQSWSTALPGSSAADDGPRIRTGRAVVVMLAGGLRRVPLHQELGIPPLCLPMGRRGSLFDAWCEALERASLREGLHVVVDEGLHAEQLRQHVLSLEAPESPRARADVMVEPAPWRGTGGVLADVARARPEAEIVVALEANCLPPASLVGLLERLEADADAIIAVSPAGEPAGMYAVRSSLLDEVRPVGYVDVKEQLLPQWFRDGHRCQAVSVEEPAMRVRSREGYLAALRMSMSATSNGGNGTAPVPATASVDASARVLGCSRLAADVTVGAGAVVHDSVLLEGAVVNPGAVVTRSILGPGSVVRGQGGEAPGVVRDRVVVRKPATRRERWGTRFGGRRLSAEIDPAGGSDRWSG